MTVDEAIAKAEPWRKEGACGPAGLVAIALLDELENARATMAKHEQEISALHAKLAGETLRADQGWQRYEAANKARINADALLSKAIPEGYVVVPAYPTDDMFVIGGEVFSDSARQYNPGDSRDDQDYGASIYRAMIAAAPSVEGEGA